MFDSGSERFRLRRRVLVVAARDGGLVDVDRLDGLLSHEGGDAEVPLDDLHLDQLLQREQVVVLKRSIGPIS